MAGMAPPGEPLPGFSSSRVTQPRLSAAGRETRRKKRGISDKNGRQGTLPCSPMGVSSLHPQCHLTCPGGADWHLLRQGGACRDSPGTGILHPEPSLVPGHPLSSRYSNLPQPRDTPGSGLPRDPLTNSLHSITCRPLPGTEIPPCRSPVRDGDPPPRTGTPRTTTRTPHPAPDPPPPSPGPPSAPVTCSRLQLRWCRCPGPSAGVPVPVPLFPSLTQCRYHCFSITVPVPVPVSVSRCRCWYRCPRFPCRCQCT